MPQPTISEILGQRSDPMQSTTPLGTSFDISQGAAQVFQAAQLKQQADWQRYSAFTKNIQDFMADAANIAKVDVAPEDRPAIMAKMAEAMKFAKDNLGAIANPMSDPAAFADVTQRGAEAYSLAVKSKQRHAWDIANRTFMQTNPEWNTGTNKKILESSFSTPIEQWQPYQLGNPMPAFDINALAEKMNLMAKTLVPETQIVGGAKDKDGKIGKGNQYVYTTSGIKYDPEKYDQAFEGVWTQQDKFGNIFSEWAKTFVWDALPESQRKEYEAKGGDPIKEATKDFVRNYRRADEISETVDINKVWKQQSDEAGATQRAKIAAYSRGSTTTTPQGGGGNALDSIPDQTTRDGVVISGGQYTKDNKPYTGTVTLGRGELSDEVVSVIAAANPGYFNKRGGGGLFDAISGKTSGQLDFESAEIQVRDGVPVSIRFSNKGEDGATLQYNPWVNRGTFEGSYQPAFGKKNTKSKESAEFGGTGGGAPPSNNDPLGINN
jgi:hypothetical protein